MGKTVDLAWDKFKKKKGEKEIGFPISGLFKQI